RARHTARAQKGKSKPSNACCFPSVGVRANGRVRSALSAILAGHAVSGAFGEAASRSDSAWRGAYGRGVDLCLGAVDAHGVRGAPPEDGVYDDFSATFARGLRAHVELENLRERILVRDEVKAQRADREMQLPRIDVRTQGAVPLASLEDSRKGFDDRLVALDLPLGDVTRVVDVLVHHEPHEHLVVGVVVEALPDDRA